MSDTRTALVLGASGGIGSEVTHRLLARGWQVRALHRTGAEGADDRGVLRIRGDALVADDVARAAQGACLLVHAVNPPGYRDWDTTVLPMLDHTIAAAVAQRARIVLPGTVYNFGPDAFPALTEDAPQHPTTRKGAIRVQMEQRLRDSVDRGARVLIVRAGDFFGPHTGNSWFAQGLVQPGRPVRMVFDPAWRGVGHQWAYLPDVAETMVRLLDREADLPPFARFHVGGHWDPDGTRMVTTVRDAVQAATGRRPWVLPFPWTLVRALGPVVPLCRELAEMRYLWQTPVRLDETALRRALGEVPHTPWEEAVTATLRGLGCLDA
ncbi:MAG: NAD(P)H-binding protein [Alphaproteobacteria bacterium]|nr:NAD(P)H-binding protein [Alphaproteobacteria bacterium]